MKLIRLPMGCLSSRSSVEPSDRAVGQQQQQATSAGAAAANGGAAANGTHSPLANYQQQQQQQQQLNTGNRFEPGSYRNDHLDHRAMAAAAGTGNLPAHVKKKNKPGPNGTPMGREQSLNSSAGTPDDDIMSLLMMDDGKTAGGPTSNGKSNAKHRKAAAAAGSSPGPGGTDKRPGSNNNSLNDDDGDEVDDEVDESADEEGENSMPSKKHASSFDEEPNMELLRQYVAVDYEITQLEDKDALRVYHEKIEQLEQLERELDMISSEVEEVAGRSESSDLQQLERSSRATSVIDGSQQMMMADMMMESNSVHSGASGTANSHRSWLANQLMSNNQAAGAIKQQTPSRTTRFGKSGAANGKKLDSASGARQTTAASGENGRNGGPPAPHQRLAGSGQYSTIEEVFNRKIILEKERDKLKKEVEMVILECDKLQQRYKKRDEILDKLFDGRTGNGLENHLEQQLNWLLEQKHYVDQVFFAWKRAETLTSQTCEQFASALELLKKLPKVQDQTERFELAKSIESLLLKSRQDMEQAQKYNPNVDAPFFTDNETERFDKIIETVQSETINPSDYSQILTVIQFAYKRAVSIRLWLEQILQTTIARDSFELAEEYKWIAIQLRKERINLIKSKLQDSPYHSMARSVQEQLIRQQSLGEQRKQQHEVNRDSGIESEANDMDIEEEIYRLLELNKSRLETAGSTAVQQAGGQQQQQQSRPHSKPGQQQLRVAGDGGGSYSASDEKRDRLMQDRVQRRVEGYQSLHLSQLGEPPALLQAAPGGQEAKHAPPAHKQPVANNNNNNNGNNSASSEQQSSAKTTITMESATGGGAAAAKSRASPTPTKLKVELDEEARRTLLKQVDQIHVRHKDRMERLKGNNRAKASEFIASKMQKVRQSTSAAGSAAEPAAGSEPAAAAAQANAANGAAGRLEAEATRARLD